jgi:hypothetical protein
MGEPLNQRARETTWFTPSYYLQSATHGQAAHRGPRFSTRSSGSVSEGCEVGMARDDTIDVELRCCSSIFVTVARSTGLSVPAGASVIRDE